MKKLVLLLLLSCSFVFAQEEKDLKTQLRHSIDELKDFIAIPNDALDLNNINRNINWLHKKFGERGFNTMVIKTENAPLFFATLPIKDNLPTVLFYMHFDGQSVDPGKWNQPSPYQVTLKEQQEGQWKTIDWTKLDEKMDPEWRLFGRSVSDDKGPIVMFLNAIDLIRKNNTDIPFNVKVILDGEEEKGSKPLPAAVKNYKELFAADFLVINDGPVHNSGKPTLVFGCRGITSVTLTTYGPSKPQHSGHYGNYAPNPGLRLAQILASMKDQDGKVLIKGYYDGIHLDASTKELLAKVPDDETDILNRLEIKVPEKVGANYQESLQYPSLNIRGLSSAWTGEQARTIVPESATAEIDLRLVPESDGNKLKSLIKAHIQSLGYTVLDHTPTNNERLSLDKIVTFTDSPVTQPFRTDMNDPNGLWIENILKNTFSEDVVKIRIMGGTVPISAFVNELKIPAFIVPMVNPDNNQHSPNENLTLGQMEYGLKVFTAMLTTKRD